MTCIKKLGKLIKKCIMTCIKKCRKTCSAFGNNLTHKANYEINFGIWKKNKQKKRSAKYWIEFQLLNTV